MLSPFKRSSNHPEQQLARLIKQRTDLQSKLHNLRSQLVADLQDGAELNGQTKAFSEIEQQIQILTEAINECEKSVTIEQNIRATHEREQRVKIYNKLAREAQQAAKAVDQAVAALGKTLSDYFDANKKALLAGSEFIRPSFRTLTPADFASISVMIDPIFRTVANFGKIIAEKRKSFTYFAARDLPEREVITQVIELNNSGWFEITYNSGFSEKVPKSKLEQMNIEPSKFYSYQSDKQQDQSDAQ